MKLDEVPQDHSATYGGHRKVVYAVDEQGRYRPAQSDGWETEAFATHLAVTELEAQATAAEAELQAGRVSPLKWLMFRYRMDIVTLSQVTGLWQWRVRRHFRPTVFRRLPERLLARYADAFGMPVEELLALQRGGRR